MHIHLKGSWCKIWLSSHIVEVLIGWSFKRQIVADHHIDNDALYNIDEEYGAAVIDGDVSAPKDCAIIMPGLNVLYCWWEYGAAVIE